MKWHVVCPPTRFFCRGMHYSEKRRAADPQHIIIRQSLGQGGEPRTLNFKCEVGNGGGRISRVAPDRRPFGMFMGQSGSRVALYFLPKGYPASVSPGYDTFIQGQMIAMVLSTACGVLSMQSMLFAIGVGAAGSLPLAATLNWVVKDGLGQLGGVVFAGVVNNQFDADPKKWRMIASLSMDVSSFIELLTPLAPAYFLPLAAFANVGKNISFLAASASRAAIHKSFAIHENLADVTAKTGSQCILASLVGTSLGLSLAAGLAGSYPSIMAAFVACSVLNLGATYFSLKGVTLTTLSVARLEFIVGQYLDEIKASGFGAKNGIATGPSLLQPEQVMEREVLLSTRSHLVPINIGADLDAAVTSTSELSSLLTMHRADQYMLTARCKSTGSSKHAEVHLLLKEDARRVDILRGLVHSVVIRRMLKDEGYIPQPLYSVLMTPNQGQWEWRQDLLMQASAAAAPTGVVSDIVDAFMLRDAGHSSNSSFGPSRDWLIEELVLELRHARVACESE